MISAVRLGGTAGGRARAGFLRPGDHAVRGFRLPVDIEKLEEYLKALAVANRLELLSLLRRPRVLGEIHLSPGTSQGAENPDRAISRQAVKNHLDRLAELGLVRVTSARRDGRALQEFVVDQARVFAITEELRRLATFESEVPLQPFATQDVEDPRDVALEEGPVVVLVHGVHEGTVFPLRPSEAKPPRGWIIGRAHHAQICLDYDPFVSSENTEILRDASGFVLLDLRTAKNGTLLNWRRLPVGGQARLRSGDVIGVGRSLLVFRGQ